MGNNRYMNIEDEDLDAAAGGYQQEEQYGEPPYDGDPQTIDPGYRSSTIRSEAVKRIQKAKLYETMLSNNLFAAGSAEPEILEEVETELKAIIEEKLEELLGMRTETRGRGQVAAALPFDEDQIEALALIANRALKRTPALGSTPTPVINQVQAEPQPTLQQPQVHQPTVIQVGQPQARRQQQAQPRQRPAAPQQSRRRPTANVGVKSGRDLSQATPRRGKQKPMPPQHVIDNMNAIQAAKNAKAPKVIPSDDAPAIDGGTSSAHVGALLAKVLQGQGGEE